MEQTREVEFVFEPQEEGGYHVYAPELPGLHTQGDTLEEATENAREALALFVEGLREGGRALDFGIIRRTLPLRAVWTQIWSARVGASRPSWILIGAAQPYAPETTDPRSRDAFVEPATDAGGSWPPGLTEPWRCGGGLVQIERCCGAGGDPVREAVV